MNMDVHKMECHCSLHPVQSTLLYTYVSIVETKQELNKGLHQMHIMAHSFILSKFVICRRCACAAF